MVGFRDARLALGVPIRRGRRPNLENCGSGRSVEYLDLSLVGVSRPKTAGLCRAAPYGGMA